MQAVRRNQRARACAGGPVIYSSLSTGNRDRYPGLTSSCWLGDWVMTGKSCAAAFLFFALGASLCAQEFRATINGRDVDPSGAAVPAVPVQVQNVATNEVASSVPDPQ